MSKFRNIGNGFWKILIIMVQLYDARLNKKKRQVCKRTSIGCEVNHVVTEELVTVVSAVVECVTPLLSWAIQSTGDAVPIGTHVVPHPNSSWEEREKIKC